MNDIFLDKNYWNKRYLDSKTGWDVGEISTPLKAYIDQIEDKNLTILVPGAGNAYEVEYLIECGFNNVYLLDFAIKPLEDFKVKFPSFDTKFLINEDFFKHNGKYDLILEQTFFCAIDPSLRENYVLQMSNLLKPNGKLVGLLFDFNFENNPPFGGSKLEYTQLFENQFNIIVLEQCKNSIEPRKGKELFMIMKKK